MSDTCRCPTHCGRPVYLAKSYAKDCPWHTERQKARKRIANARYRQKHGYTPRTDKPKVAKQTKARHRRWLKQDISTAEIEHILDLALPWIRYQHRTKAA